MACAPRVVGGTHSGQDSLELIEPSPVWIPLEIDAATLPYPGHLVISSVSQVLNAERCQGLEAPIVVQKPPGRRQEFRSAGIQTERGHSRSVWVAERYDRCRS